MLHQWLIYQLLDFWYYWDKILSTCTDFFRGDQFSSRILQILKKLPQRAKPFSYNLTVQYDSIWYLGMIVWYLLWPVSLIEIASWRSKCWWSSGRFFNTTAKTMATHVQTDTGMPKKVPETGQLASCQPEIKMSSLAHAHSVTPGRFSFNGRIWAINKFAVTSCASDCLWIMEVSR